MRIILGLVVVVVCGASCGSAEEAAAGRPSIVVTHGIIGDVVSEVAGDQADVTVVLPPGADPHEFAASARQAEAMALADLLVINGSGFEEGLLDVIEAARDDGATTFVFTDHVELLDGGHLEEDEQSAAEDQGEGEDHAEEASDPHFWTDPTRMAAAVDDLAMALAEVDGIDQGTVEQAAAAYLEELAAVDADVEQRLDSIPEADRVLVTNHEVLGYFADRYGFEVVGTVIPSQSTGAAASAAELEALSEVIVEQGVPAIFGETSSPSAVARALADEAGDDVEVVELYTESLGEEGSSADTYLGLLRTNADLIAGALG